jgi:hypothetical protein
MLKRPLMALLFFFCLYCASAQAVTFRFDLEIFTDNGNYNDNPGGDFYFLLSEDGGLPKFEFHNDSTFSSSITDIYFDGAVLAGISSITQSAGVDFTAGANPTNLPGANILSPAFVADFGADSNPPPSFNGVNNSLDEWVAIVMDTTYGKTFTDVLDALRMENLRVGVHLQTLPDGSSESAVNNPDSPIPEPSIIGLLGLAGLGVFWKKRK